MLWWSNLCLPLCFVLNTSFQSNTSIQKCSRLHGAMWLIKCAIQKPSDEQSCWTTHDKSIIVCLSFMYCIRWLKSVCVCMFKWSPALIPIQVTSFNCSVSWSIFNSVLRCIPPCGAVGIAPGRRVEPWDEAKTGDAMGATGGRRPTEFC